MGHRITAVIRRSDVPSRMSAATFLARVEANLKGRRPNDDVTVRLEAPHLPRPHMGFMSGDGPDDLEWGEEVRDAIAAAVNESR
jgi:hypothetical protein